jgi:hypothetical protein
MYVQYQEVRLFVPSAKVRRIGHDPYRNSNHKDCGKCAKPEEYLGPLAAHVCSTPVLNSGIIGFKEVDSRAQINASRVCAGSMMASTQRCAAA